MFLLCTWGTTSKPSLAKGRGPISDSQSGSRPDSDLHEDSLRQQELPHRPTLPHCPHSTPARSDIRVTELGKRIKQEAAHVPLPTPAEVGNSNFYM